MCDSGDMVSQDYFDQHRALLERAAAACASRAYFSAYDESPSPRVYGENAAAEGAAAFEAWLGADFPLSTPGSNGTTATERSPYGFDLGVRYPRAQDMDVLLHAAMAGMKAWRDAGPDVRSGIAWRSSTGCTSGSSSSPTPSSTPAVRRS